MRPVFINGDSRLTDFESYIRTENEDRLPIYVEAQRGARLNQLGTMTVNRLHNTPGAAVMIAGGINDCSFKNTLTGKYLFTFENANDMVYHIMNHIEIIDSLIRRVHSEPKVTYCDIIGMDLQAYKWCEDPKPGQQNTFNNAILEINQKIVALNKKNNVITPWIAKTVHIPRKDCYNHLYERLEDGLHWNHELKIACAKRLVRAARKLME